jgi:hypothetical protein
MFAEGFQASVFDNGDASSWRFRMVTLLALTVTLFNQNGLNYWLINDPTTPSSNLPEELYTTGVISNLVPRVIIAPWSVLVYLLVGIVILGFCVSSLGWSMTIQRPQITRFPLIDFAARILSRGFAEGSLANMLIELTAGDSAMLRKSLLTTKVYLGDTRPERDEQDKVGKIGFSTIPNVEPLKKGELYE